MKTANDWLWLGETTVSDTAIPALSDSPQWHDVVFERCDFRAMNLAKAVAFNCVFEDCDFRGVSMVKAEFFGCRFVRCAMDGAKTKWATFTDGAEFIDTPFSLSQIEILDEPIGTTRKTY